MKTRKGTKMEKTVEMLKWGKGYYVMTRIGGQFATREFVKNKTTATAKVKEFKKLGYEQI